MKFNWPISFADSESKAENLTFSQLLERMSAMNQVYSGENVSPSNAMECTTIQGIIRALTNAIGSYPPSIGKVESNTTGDTVVPLPNHQLNRLLKVPNKIQTSTEFFRLLMTHAALHGNFYALKGQGQAGPVGYLRPIEDPNRVSVDDVNWATGITYRVQFDDGEQIVPQSRMVHITSGIPSSDGVTGISPVEKAKQAIGICLAAERLIAQLYGNNDVPTMALIGGMFRSEEDYALWVQKFKEARGGTSDGRGGTLLLPEGMEAKEMSFTPTDAQLLEMRKFQRIEIAQVYGVPPHKLADLERATFSNIEEQSLEFVRDVAHPWIIHIQQALARDLLTEDDRRSGVVVRFDMEAATEGKLKERIDAYAKAHEVGAMNPNEIRQRLGMGPRDDEAGDDFVSSQTTRIDNDDIDNDDPEGTGAGEES